MPEDELGIPAQIETRKLDTLRTKSNESLGEFTVTPVGDAGFIISNQHLLPMAGNDWVMFDFDDTIGASTEIKAARLSLFQEHAQSLGINLPNEELARLMKKTDEFSRWKDASDTSTQYHINAHMSALSWATTTLAHAFDQKRHGTTIDTDQVLRDVNETLDRVHSQTQTNTESRPDDPFYFQQDTNKFVLRFKKPWSKEIEDIFMQTSGNPPEYEEMVQAATLIAGPKDSIHRTNIGMFTYGDPYFQLSKILELLKKNPNLPVNQVWLTRVPKGEFIKKLVETNAAANTPLQYVPANLEEDAFEGISPGSGYPLGKHEHVIVMLDDNRKELDSILSSNEVLKKETGASFVVVRSRRDKTKDGINEWEVSTPNGEIDFRSSKFSAPEVSTIVQINRYLEYINRFGINNPRSRAIAEELQQSGADLTHLENKTLPGVNPS